MKCNELGRSMVEMLGVLAIIGVLSVGAISGYSKAMTKYKLNKQAESVTLLLANVTQLSLNLGASDKSLSNASILKKLNIIPDGISEQNDKMYDIFHNSISFGSAPHASLGRETYLFFDLERTNNKVSNSAVNICLNIINAAKEYSQDIFVVQIRQYGETGETGDYQAFSLYGSPYCSSSRRCLLDAKIQDLQQFCSQCESQTGCSLGIFWAQTNPYY